MTTTYVCGVFQNEEELSKALTSLRDRGLSDLTALKDKAAAAAAKTSEIKVIDPMKTYFIWSGAIGAVIGGIAGAIASPTVPFEGTYQIVTPMMAMVSAGALFAYMGVLLCGFWTWLDKPIVHADMCNASITDGAFALVVTATSREQKLLSIECLENCGATEITVRNEENEVKAPVQQLEVVDSAASSKRSQVAA